MVRPNGAPPATTLRLTSLRQIACSKAECAQHYPARPLGSSALRFRFAIRVDRLLMRSLPPRLRLYLAGPSRVIQCHQLKKFNV
jgi:hypothetical protein